MTFRWKLFFSYALLAILMASAFFFQFNRVLEGRIVEESRQSLMNEALLAKIAYGELSGRLPHQKIAEQLGGASRSRVTIVAPDGGVLGDSDVRSDQVASLENHRNRIEIKQALETGSGSSIRYSDTLRAPMLYVAVASQSAGNAVIRLALPLEHLQAAKSSMRTLLVWTVAGILVLAMLVSAILSGMNSRPMRAMAEAAARFGAGERGVRMPVKGKDELGYLGRVLNQMAERLEDQMDGLTRERQRLDAILNGMGEGVMVLDIHGVITLVNPAFRQQFGLTGDLLGRALVEVCRHPELLQCYDEHRSTNGEVLGVVTLPLGNTILSVHWMPLGERQGSVAVFHDISELKRTEAIRRDFVANVSHELRTPVSVIKGYAETLLDGAIEGSPERSRHFVSIIAGHAERLTTLINDILALSRLEARGASLDLHPVELCGVFAKASTMLEERARAKGIELKVACSEKLPGVMADQGQLEQVLLNLLDNAIKYTPAGGTVTFGASSKDSGVAIVVSDTGLGIPAKDLPRIFERFYRVDEARSREQGGTGLGLAIVKHIVQLHGGEITVESEPGKGSCFTVFLKTC